MASSSIQPNSWKVIRVIEGELDNLLGQEEVYWHQRLGGVNNTLIVMIPKINRAECMFDFCPISLCNAIYKVVAKSLANRLLAVLNDVIFETQSAFIPGRFRMYAYSQKKEKGSKMSGGSQTRYVKSL
ncbi:hypothetical protein Dsin_016642 [Dipteronia sinensis]|uniref:Reverse transcriptase domain-containing protein n=1 Tax=Dipteronia sinensis TaxID=43782 RepID=A0AAE0AE40_9ROSI|nr:hypothetical protein Dsin_016642 [Dipteronia sinensis]